MEVDAKSVANFFCYVIMSAAMYYYAYLFLKKKNYFLGVEWLVLATSAGNFAVYHLTHSQLQWDIMIWFDAFSRAFGMTLLTIAGMMAASHLYKPSITVDVWLFSVTMLLTCLIWVDSVEPLLPWIYIVSWYIFAAYLVWFTKKLFAGGETLAAAHLGIGTVLLTIIHTIYDFYEIPGDKENVFINFYFLAGIAWTYLYSVIYYSYEAMERITSAKEPHMRGVVAAEKLWIPQD